MAKKKNPQRTETVAAPTVQSGSKRWLAPAAMILMLGAAAAIFHHTYRNRTKPAAKPVELTQMTVAQAVMVTVELDFGGRVPTIAEAIQQVERGYAPDDGNGRTFAVLDAYGEPTADGKLLHMSMHVSSEKPGMGYLRFKRTGELLWQGRIGKPGDPPAGGKSLTIYVDNGAGGQHLLDGGRGGDSVLNVFLQNSEQKVRDVWPDGAVREVTYVYSACGCPVKVQVRRAGERTARVTDTPVIFPDDPDAVRTIAGLMKW